MGGVGLGNGWVVRGVCWGVLGVGLLVVGYVVVGVRVWFNLILRVGGMIMGVLGVDVGDW